MTITPPENLNYATITHRLLRTLVDTSDAGREPDIVAAEGATVTITPRVTQYKNLALPATVITTGHKGVYDSQGYLRDATTGELGVVVTAPDSGQISPNGWQYTVQIQAAGSTFPAFPITVNGGDVIDLTTVSPAIPTTPVVTIVSEETRIAAESAAIRAEEAAASIETDIGVAVEAYLDANPPTGGGGDGTASDGSVAVLIQDTNSQTRAALNTYIAAYNYVTSASLSSALAGKANTSHTHTISNVTGLQDALNAKSAVGHGHVAADISNFNATVDSRVQAIVGAAPAALDTLDELANALGDDPNFAGTVTTALANRVRTDAPQTLTAGQQSQARTNIGAADATTTTTALNKRVEVVNHGSNASTARPTGASSVLWIGTVEPTNMTESDVYNGPGGLGTVGDGPTDAEFEALLARVAALESGTGGGGGSETPTGPTIIAQDFFEGTTTSGWGTAAVGGAWTATTSRTSKSGGAGIMRLEAANAGATARLAETVATDLIGQVTVSADKLANGSGVFYLFRTRITETGDEYRFKINIASNGAITAWWATSISGTEVILAGGPSRSVPVVYEPGTRLVIKASAIGSGPTRLQSKIWVDGQTEPTAWLHDFEDSASVLQQPGHIGLYAQLSSGTTNVPVTFKFDDLEVTGTAAVITPGGEDEEPVDAPDTGGSAGILKTFNLDDASLPATNLGAKAGGVSQTFSPASVFQVVQVPIDNYGDGVAVPERFQVVRGADVAGTGAAKPTSSLRVELRPGDRQISGAKEYNRMEAYDRHAVPGNTPPAQWPDPPGSERWYIWKVLFPEDFLFGGEGGRPHVWESIFQWKGYPDRGSPMTNIDINRRTMRLGGVYGPGTQIGGSIVPGLWTVLAVGQKFSPDAAVGWSRAYRDGVEAVPQNFHKTLEGTPGAPESVYIKYGLYRSASWTVTHTIHLGNLVITDNYTDAMSAMQGMMS